MMEETRSRMGSADDGASGYAEADVIGRTNRARNILVNGGRKNINVTPCTEEFYQENKREAYPMNKPVRGKVLIINVNQVKGCKPRTGTDIDRDNLKNLFKKLQFEVEVRNDEDGLTAQGIEQHVARFAKQPSQAKTQCVVVCVLSHGNEGDVILGTDGKYVKCKSLEQNFYNSNRYMRDKPKLFLYQACRGDMTDDGVPRPEADGALGDTMPLISDMYHAYPTPEGYAAWRDPAEGSWFISAFVDAMMKYAATLDIDRIFNRVNSSVASKVTGPGWIGKKQISEQKKNLTKDFYFFPGIVQRDMEAVSMATTQGVTVHPSTMHKVLGLEKGIHGLQLEESIQPGGSSGIRIVEQTPHAVTSKAQANSTEGEKYADEQYQAGTLCYDRGEWRAAIAHYSQSLETRRRLLQEATGAQHWILRTGMGNALHVIGYCYGEMGGHSADEIEKYKECLEIRRQMHQEQPQDRGVRTDLGDTLNNLGICYNDDGDRAQAVKCYNESLQIRRKLNLEQPQDRKARTDLGYTLHNLGLCYKADGDHSKAMQYYKESLKIERALLKDGEPDDKQMKESIAITLDNMGNCYIALDQPEEARRCYAESKQLRK